MQGAPPETYFGINKDLALKVATEAMKAGVKHFIFLSTAHVFGSTGSPNLNYLNRQSPCHPSDDYGKSKLAAETELTKLQSADFKVSIVRPPMVYGEGAKGNLVNLGKIIKAFPILPLGYDSNRRSLIYVGNLTFFIHLLIDKKLEGIFLPQDQRPISIQNLCELIAKAMHTHVLLLPVPDFLVKLFFIVNKKISARLFGTLAFDPADTVDGLGYSPPFTTEEGLNKMFAVKSS